MRSTTGATDIANMSDAVKRFQVLIPADSTRWCRWLASTGLTVDRDRPLFWTWHLARSRLI